MANFNDWNNYGGLYVEDNSTAETTTDATPRKIGAFTTVMPSSSSCTPSATTNDITVTDAGDYVIEGTLSFSGTLSKTFEVEIYKDTTASGIKLQRKLGTGGDVGSASVKGIVTLTAGQAVSLYHSSTDGGTAFTLVNGSLTVNKIGWQ